MSCDVLQVREARVTILAQKEQKTKTNAASQIHSRSGRMDILLKQVHSSDLG